MCVACRESQEKRSLVRLVRTPDGVFVDESGKLPGRGAYLHDDPVCWESGVKKYLQKALRTTFSEKDLERLQEYQASIAAVPETGKQGGGSDINQDE
jgi:predicted RNA-binding protein YlxR (DUF448 family)